MKMLPLGLVTLLSSTLLADLPECPAAVGPNAHAWEMFQTFRQMTKGNFCFSPFSEHQMASVLAEGARGSTQQQLLNLAHLPADPEKRAADADFIRQALTQSMTRPGLTLEVANSIWVPSILQLQPTYVTWLGKHLGVMIQKMPDTDSVGRAVEVNRWIRGKTRGRIKDLVGPTDFQRNGNTLMLVNAVLFKSNWAKSFDPRVTKNRAFLMSATSQKMLPMMAQTNAFLSADSPAWQSVEMPLVGGDFCMSILLPRTETDRESVESGLNTVNWQKVLAGQSEADVSLMLPRFSFSTQVNLQGLWQALGTRDVFESSMADLRGMIQQQPCWVSGIQHEAAIEVNELGTVAAAATVAAEPFGDSKSAPKRRTTVFVANHTFIWIIQHKPTGLILFMGRFAGE